MKLTHDRLGDTELLLRGLGGEADLPSGGRPGDGVQRGVERTADADGGFGIGDRRGRDGFAGLPGAGDLGAERIGFGRAVGEDGGRSEGESNEEGAAHAKISVWVRGRVRTPQP